MIKKKLKLYTKDEKLELYTKEDIRKKGEEIKRHNAFIRSDGTFYLAKGYMECDPRQQLDSSALQVGRQDIGLDFIEKYKENYKNIVPSLITYTDEEKRELLLQYANFKSLNYKCEMPMAFYEDCLANNIKNRQKLVMLRNELKRISSILIQYYGYALYAMKEDVDSELGREDESIVPNPEFYGKSATKEQIETLEKLYYLDSSEDFAKKKLFYVENHLSGSCYWHY